ncbi:hypothetical protein GPEL0_01f5052 [Geoanaerobacter pelophilus]|uniref:FlgN protein n=1 Tax=Geoanaerobacter pelophilus TaxID=60036 RepID=A0ABQ0MNG7_9BACT|nr:flagellar protein FliT [Geoanaerobacter pelophilus]GAW68630.1 hypothetical protein GPEL0_01f5052 [Geoanaerobacter pelophilus]
MNHSLLEMIAEAEQKHLLLLQEANDLLKRLEYIGPEELADLLERRQTLVEWIQDFDAAIAGADCSGPVERAALDSFKIFQRETIGKVLEVDGLVTGLAQGKCSSIQASLSSMKKSKRIRNAFDNAGSVQQHSLDRKL